MDTQHALAPAPHSRRSVDSRRTRLAVAAIVVPGLLLQLGALLFSYLNRVVPGREDLSNWPNDLLYAVPFLSMLGVGALVALRRPHHPYGWLWLLSGGASAFQSFTRGYAGYGLLTAPGVVPGAELALLLTAASWFILIGSLPFLLLLFPTGRLPSGLWRPVAWAVVVLGFVTSGIGWAAPGPSAFIPTENPLGVEGHLGTAADLARNIGVAFVLGGILAGVVSVGLRFRRAEGVERQQYKWFALAGALLGADLIGQFFVTGLLIDIANALALAALPIATGIAILRHRLFDIDLIIRRTLIYGALTAILSGMYALAVGATSALLPSQGSLLPLLVTLAVAVPLARPLHGLLQRLPLPESKGRHADDETSSPEPTAATAAEMDTPAGTIPASAPQATAHRVVSVESISRRAGTLRLAQVAALLIAAVATAQFIVSVPLRYAELRELCLASAVRCEELARPTSAEAQLLASLGLSLEAHALVTMTLIVASAAIWLGAAALIFVYRRDDWMALLTALMLALLGTGLFGGGEALAQTSPAWWLAAKLVGLCTFGAAILFFYLFPGGQFAPRWSRWFALAWLVSNTVTLLVDEQPAWLSTVSFFGFFIPALASIAFLVYRYRRIADQTQRQQVKWVVFGLAATLGAILTLLVLAGLAFGSLSDPRSYLLLSLQPILFLGIPFSIGIAILRHRLFDIDVIIRRTVVYGALVGALVALYFGSVALIQALARELTGPQSDLAIVALTLLVAALFNPLRVRVQSFIDRRFYREKVDFRVAFTAFAREVRTVIELPALLGLLVERTTALLHIAHGAVFLRQEDGAFALAEGRSLPPGADALPADADDLARLAGGEPIGRPRDAAFPLLLPLLAPRPTADHSVATDLVGVLALGPRRSDQRFSRDDESLLLGLADQAGTAIYVAQLIALQRAEAARREEQERQMAARRASPIGRAEDTAAELLADLPAAFVTLHRLANEAGQSVEAARLLEHLPRAISLHDHPAAARLTALADGLSYLVASRAQPELLPAGLRALAANLQPGAGEPLTYAAEALALYEHCGRAFEANTVAAIAELLPQLPEPGARHTGPLSDLAAALGELHEAAGALRAYERVDTPQDRLAYLAAAVERLSRVDRTAAELGAADQPLVQRVAERWLAVAAGVMGELQTRARLACRLLTRHTWHDDLVALTLTIRNDGRGAALNLQVSLTAGGEYTPLDAPARVERLLTGEEVSLTLRVRPHIAPGAGYFRARFLVRYDDPRGPDQVEQFADEVQLLGDEGAFQFIPNPYVVGTPLQNGSPLFFGRQDVLGFIEENLQAAHRNNLVLIGQRRTGKTSLLKQLPDRLGDGYLPVYLDGQSLGLDPGMPSFFLALATEIAFALDDRGISIEPPEPEEFLASPAAAFERGFLPRVRAALGGRHLLLLLDEFEELEAAVRRGSLDASLFGFLRHLIQHAADLSVIFCGTHRLEELAADYWSVLFNISLYRHVGFLSRDEAERLVQEPVMPYGMRYDGLALEKIWRVTSGHPYFLQLLCHSLVNRHNKSGRSYLTVADLNDALDEILAAGEAHFVYLWAESSEQERLALAALSRAVPLTGRATPAHVADYLAGRGVGLERGAVADALHRLALRDILAADSAAGGAGDAYGWKLGLLGLWVEKYRSLSRVIDEVRV